MVKNLPAILETRVRSLGQEDPLEKGVATTAVFLTGEVHGPEEPADFSPWVLKESNITERLRLSLFHLPGWLRAQVLFCFVFLIMKKLGLKSLIYHFLSVTFYSCFTLLCFDFFICKTELLICISEDFCED